MTYRILLACVVAFSLAGRGMAALSPEEIVIIAARGNRESEGLAKYYARVRGVPEKNICLVDLPAQEQMPQEMWQWGVRPEIQKWLKENDPERKIRCLLTVWGVPLKIAPAAPSDESRKYKAFLEAERAHRLQLLGTVKESLDRIAADGTAPGEDATDESSIVPTDFDKPVSATSTETVTTDAVAGNGAAPAGAKASAQKSELQRQRTELEKALQSAQARLGKMEAGDERNRGQMQLQQLAAVAGGANVILQGLNQQLAATPNANQEARSEFDILRGRAAGFAEMRLLLEQMAPGVERDAMVLATLERLGGLLGTVEWLDAQLSVVAKNETGASFDSELALVTWPDDYQLLRWQPNYLRPGYENSQLPTVYRTLMVARLDAPTLLLAKGLVDTAIKVEKEGLKGMVYIDARGLGSLEEANVVPGSYPDYDRALLITAKGIEEQTDLDVVLDTSPELFQPGKCPDAALYCGWYSLAKYVDAFDWKPGAVAYHLASGEARTLREPDSQAWCKKLLEDGVCATIGPVYEPYLASFPRPNEFFALLLQGDLTVAECYARTSPFNSWMMTLIGDPLYRPFKNRVPSTPPTEPAGR